MKIIKEAIMDLNKKDIHIYFDIDGTVNHWDLNGNPHEEHYFRYREPFKNVLNAIKMLQKNNYNVSFATAVYMEGNAKSDKIIWLNNNDMKSIPVIFIPYGSCKNDYLEKGDIKILIDDYTPNLIEFEKSGGIAIKMINRNNHKKGIWNGHCIYYNDSPEEIVKSILSVF